MDLLLLRLAAIAACAGLGLPAGWIAWRLARRLSAKALPASGLECALMTGALFAWAAAAGPGWPLLAASLALGWGLAVLCLVDIADLRLPDVVTAPLGLLGLAVSVLLPVPDPLGHLAGAAIGYGAIALVAWLYRRLRGGDGLGLGDAKLMAVAGLWLGWSALPTVLILACVTAFLWVGLMAIRKRSLSPRTAIAFGPPLALGIWLVWLYGPLAPS